MHKAILRLDVISDSRANATAVLPQNRYMAFLLPLGKGKFPPMPRLPEQMVL